MHVSSALETVALFFLEQMSLARSLGRERCLRHALGLASAIVIRSRSQSQSQIRSKWFGS